MSLLLYRIKESDNSSVRRLGAQPTKPRGARILLPGFLASWLPGFLRLRIPGGRASLTPFDENCQNESDIGVRPFYD